jgi:hypothetical protein
LLPAKSTSMEGCVCGALSVFTHSGTVSRSFLTTWTSGEVAPCDVPALVATLSFFSESGPVVHITTGRHLRCELLSGRCDDRLGAKQHAVSERNTAASVVPRALEAPVVAASHRFPPEGGHGAVDFEDAVTADQDRDEIGGCGWCSDPRIVECAMVSP